jgi:hypothetical protein
VFVFEGNRHEFEISILVGDSVVRFTDIVKHALECLPTDVPKHHMFRRSFNDGHHFIPSARIGQSRGIARALNVNGKRH